MSDKGDDVSDTEDVVSLSKHDLATDEEEVPDICTMKFSEGLLLLSMWTELLFRNRNQVSNFKFARSFVFMFKTNITKII